MTIVNLILLILAAAVGAGGVSAYFKKGEGKATIDLLKTQIDSYKDTEARLMRENGELRTFIKAKEKTITEQRSTIKIMVREFKDYKNAQ